MAMMDEMEAADKKNKKVEGINETLVSGNSFLQKMNQATALFLLAPAANMLGPSRVPAGCMIWQHVVNLESICETNLMIFSLPAQQTGLFTPLRTCSPLLFFPLLLGQIVIRPTLFLPFTL